MRFSDARDDRGAARRTSRAATRPSRAFSVNRRRRRASSIDRSRLNAGKNARGGQKRPVFLAPDFFFGHFLVPPGASAR